MRLLVVVAAFIACLLPTAVMAQQAAPLIPRALLFGNATQNRAKISPDGRLLAWVAPSNGVMNIWVAPVNDRSAARAVTSETHRGVDDYQWSPDSGFILYGQDSGGNENFRIYAVNASTGERRPLSPEGANIRADIAGISALRPDVILISHNQRSPTQFDLFEINYRTGASRLAFTGEGFVGIWTDRLHRVRLGVRNLDADRVVFVRPSGKADGSWQEVRTMSREDYFGFRIIGFNRAGTEAYAVSAEGRDKAALFRLDPQTGRMELMASSDLADVEEVLLDSTSFEPVAYSVNHQLTVWYPLSPAYRRDLEAIQGRIGNSAELLFSSNRDDSSATQDGSRMIVWVVRADRPQAYYLYDRRTRQMEELFFTRPALAAQPLQPMHLRVLRARDGLSLVSYLTLPPGSDADGDGRPERPVPMVLSVHGGPWARDYHGYSAQAQWLANRGYAVLQVNYRGSQGFGKSFLNAAIHQFAGAMHNDLIDGVDWAIAQGITTRDRVAIMGGSYGGYATLVGVSFTPDRFRCGVDSVGPSSLATLIESFPAYWRADLQTSWFRFVGDPAVPADRARMLAQSPISRIDAIRVPLLVQQGGNDPRVTKPESDRIVAGLVQRGIPVTYLNFPDEGHGLNRPQNRTAFSAVAEQFLAQCLGGRAEPIGDDVRASSAEVLEGAAHVPGLAEASRGR